MNSQELQRKNRNGSEQNRKVEEPPADSEQNYSLNKSNNSHENNSSGHIDSESCEANSRIVRREPDQRDRIDDIRSTAKSNTRPN